MLPVKFSKPIDGPVKQHAKVIAIHAKVATNFLVISVFKETCLQQMAVSFRKFVQNCAYQLSMFPELYQFFQAQFFIGHVIKLQRIMLIAGIVAAAFRENVLADGVYIRAKALRIIDATGLDGHPDTAEGFLAHIFNRSDVYAARAQGDPQAFTKISNKMCFGGRIMGPETAQVFLIEGIEVHWRSFQPVYFSLCCCLDRKS